MFPLRHSGKKRKGSGCGKRGETFKPTLGRREKNIGYSLLYPKPLKRGTDGKGLNSIRRGKKGAKHFEG